MIKAAAFRASYSDWRLIRTRKCVQIVLEIPVEQADEAYQVLGGMPNAGEEAWVAVARLTNGASGCSPAPREAVTGLGQGSPPPTISGDKRLTRQAGILCNDKRFQAWLRETNPAWALMNLGTDAEKAAEIVRARCGVKSRRDIRAGTPAAEAWERMMADYEMELT